MSGAFHLDELTSEKSLWDVYLGVRKIGPSWGALAIFFISLFSLFYVAFCGAMSYEHVIEAIRKWSEIGVQVSLTVLGFIVSGFTIFVTLTKPEMFLAMMAHHDKRHDLPYLKYYLFVFMGTFISYLFSAVVFILAMLFVSKGGVGVALVSGEGFRGIVSIDVLARFLYVLVALQMILMVLWLNIFIFNIYAAVMNHLRWEEFVRRSDGR